MLVIGELTSCASHVQPALLMTATILQRRAPAIFARTTALLTGAASLSRPAKIYDFLTPVDAQCDATHCVRREHRHGQELFLYGAKREGNGEGSIIAYEITASLFGRPFIPARHCSLENYPEF